MQAVSPAPKPAPPSAPKPAPAPALKPAPAPLTPVTLTDFKLAGNLTDNLADFTITATAHVEDARGGALDLISGPVALTAIEAHPNEHIRAEQNRFILAFDRPGNYPVKVRFSAAVKQVDGWNALDFHVAPSVLQPVVLQGLAPETQFQFPGAARPDRSGGDFLSYLPASGAVKFSWKEVGPETEGKLFFSAEMLSQINVLPSLMRQTALLNFKVMQGELSRVTLLLHGEGEVTRVQPDNLVLGWTNEPVPNSTDRRLVIQLNQPQKDQFSILVQAQTSLGAFPLTAEALQIRPENATRFGGYFRVVNEGAVRLEVARASGASANLAGPISRNRRRPGRCFARRATSGLSIGLPGRISRCGFRRTRFCRSWRYPSGWPITTGKTNWCWTRKSNWTSARPPCANWCSRCPKATSVARLNVPD